jgi:hypothetical protein
MGKKLKTKIKDKMVRCQFLHACSQARRAHNKVNAIRFKIIKTCLRDLNKAGFPATAEEKDLMSQMINLYDKTLSQLSEEVNRFRFYIGDENETN